MSPFARHVLVMAKSPVPGRVKTRLCPPCSPEEAAGVAAAALADTLDAVSGCRAARKILALDGDLGPWLPPGFEVIAQRGASFADRLANAWSDAGTAGIQIGMDTPQIRADQLDGLLAALEGPPDRAVLGLAVDGGWWVIGWGNPGLDPVRVFGGVPLSTPQTGACQARRLRRLGYTVVDAGRHRDIDTVSDLAAVARLVPHTRTGRLAVAARVA